MQNANSVARVVVSGYFDLKQWPTTIGKETSARMMALSVPQYWRDEVSGEWMSAHFWVDLLFRAMPSNMEQNLHSGQFRGAVVHGKLQYRSTGKHKQRERALIVVEAIQLLP